PHRYTRTQALLDEFAGCFEAADTVTVLDIYAASEPPIPGVTGQALAARIPGARYAPAIDDAVA
ncbi:MAG TPA: UDP-N-acetylmuramate--L-alanine ligase, partial [Solibacterales bacterium]|nr:UDP-N-acetylmuramate--L-alanine ligase [Bryobacterales bacterium]